MRAQFVGDGFADQPQGIVSEPTIRGLGLVQFQLVLEQVAQAVQQFALQGGSGRGKCAGGVAAEFLCDGGAVGLDDEFTQHARMFVLTGQHVQQGYPKVGVSAEPVQNVAVKQLVIKQSCGSAVQTIFPALAVTEAVRLLQRAVPRVSDNAVHQFDVDVHGNLADVVQQRGVGGRRRTVLLGLLDLRQRAAGVTGAASRHRRRFPNHGRACLLERSG